MKKITQLLALALVFNSLISCDTNLSSTTGGSSMATTIASTENNRTVKTQLVNADNAETIDRFSLDGVTINLETLETIAMNQMSAESADAQAIMSINQALMGAEKEAQVLDVKFSMSDEPVDNGMFIFSIESPNAKNLTLEMFDEEGFSMAANNKFDVNEGNNYKALNVNSMENGDYLFRLKDDAGKELVRNISISNQ